MAPEKFSDLTGQAAYDKFVLICCARGQVDMICDVDQKIIDAVNTEFPTMSREARAYAHKTFKRVYPAFQ
jgi:hypothetical protein